MIRILKHHQNWTTLAEDGRVHFIALFYQRRTWSFYSPLKLNTFLLVVSWSNQIFLQELKQKHDQVFDRHQCLGALCFLWTWTLFIFWNLENIFQRTDACWISVSWNLEKEKKAICQNVADGCNGYPLQSSIGVNSQVMDYETIVFFLFCIRLVELVELGELN